MNDAPCAQQSLDVGEPVFGTAVSHVERWLLLEHDGQWDREALASPGIPAEARAHLQAFLGQDKRARFQLVRDELTAAEAFPRRLFAIDASEGRHEVRVVQLASWESLLALDLAGLFAERAPDGAHEHGPVVLVCTHGRRDVCCARLGVPVFRELARDLANDAAGVVLQTSHVGGHRFAANIVLLPHGYHYGRLDQAAARRVMRGYFAGRLTDLDRLRGRSCYATEVQAAEFWVRQGTGRYGLGGLQLKRCEAVTQGQDARVEVTFWDADTDELHELTVVRETTADMASPSCGEAAKPVVRHRLESYRHIAGAAHG
ncbi:MAG TPA: sucrase ferredoxin [Myxococcota bacterium]|nr:sucrase ferredoxin [Myxococcota bacterium]